jgi:hypothetical protein
MTKSGSAFDSIAKRMQDTWAGQIEAMVSQIQLFSAELLKTVTEVDNALGSPLQNILKGTIKSFEFLTNAIKFLKPVLIASAGTVAVYAASWAVINFKLIVTNIGLLIAKLYLQAKAAWAAAVAHAGLQTAMNPGVGVAIVATIVGVTAALINMSSEAQKGSSELEKINGKMDESKEVTAEDTFRRIAERLASLSLKAKALREEMERLGNLDKGGGTAEEAKATEQRNKKEKELNTVLQQRTKLITEVRQKYGEAVADQLELAAKQMETEQEKLNLIKEYVKEQDNIKAAFGDFKKRAEEFKEAISKIYDTSIKARQENINQIRKISQEEAKAARESREAIVSKYDSVQQKLDGIYASILRNIDAEISALQKRGPKEQELYDLNKQELEDKIKKGDLQGKELLQLEAQLERMERQEEIEKKQNERKQIELKQEQDNLRLKQLQNAELEKFDKIEEARAKRRDNEIKKLEKEIQDLEKAKKVKIDMLDIIIEREKKQFENYKAMNKEFVDLIESYRKLITYSGNVAANIETARKEAEKLAEASSSALTEVGKSQTNSGKSGSLTPEERVQELRAQGIDLETGQTFRFAGGLVSGGSKYTVNELGKEAFLSAAGRLSMINAPSWGTWKAPSSGTVIPAHLTKQLDIPQGGVNLNRQPNFDQRKAGRNPMSQMLSALSGAGSDNIQNNVTVQSMNPTKTASDMLVQLTKLRRRRMY